MSKHQISLILFVSSMLFMSCASNKKNKSSGNNKATVKVESSAELAELKPTLQTREDSLLLDLMLGYREIILQGQSEKMGDAEVFKKSRKAYDRLEKILRHGGLSSQDAGERVFTVDNEDRLSFQQVIDVAVLSGQKAALSGDWDTARQRWLEIIQGKPIVLMGLEEANWGLALFDALSSNLNEGIKKKLKDLNESYVHAAPYDEISQQVVTILNEIESEKLRKELKKLANRAFEREKKNGKGNQSNPIAQEPVNEGKNTETTGNKPSREMALHQVDSLFAAGKYIPALKVLEKMDDKKDPAVFQEKKKQIGDRFCEDKRRDAASAFGNYKKSVNDSLRIKYLKTASQHLDSCLFSFGDLSVSQKVRKNREMVEAEMRKLGK